jgi:hypothetical protein
VADEHGGAAASFPQEPLLCAVIRANARGTRQGDSWVTATLFLGLLSRRALPRLRCCHPPARADTPAVPPALKTAAALTRRAGRHAAAAASCAHAHAHRAAAPPRADAAEAPPAVPLGPPPGPGSGGYRGACMSHSMYACAPCTARLNSGHATSSRSAVLPVLGAAGRPRCSRCLGALTWGAWPRCSVCLRASLRLVLIF